MSCRSGEKLPVGSVKSKLIALYLSVLASLNPSYPAHSEKTIDRGPYTAIVGDNGVLKSVRVQKVEVLGGPLSLFKGVEFQSVKITEAQGGDLRATLTGNKGKAELLYHFDDSAFFLKVTQSLGSSQSWRLPFSENVLCVENLQDNGVTAAEAIQYKEDGEKRCLPAIIARTQRIRLYLSDGSQVIVYHEGWSAPFNFDEIGRLSGYEYQGSPIKSGGSTRIWFVIEKLGTKPLAPGPVFTVSAERRGNIFYTGEQVVFDVEVQPLPEALRAAQQWTLSCVVRDFWDRVVYEGSVAVGSTDFNRPLRALLPVSATGWFSVKFALKPQDVTDTMCAPSEFSTRFCIFTNKPGFVPRPLPLDPPPSDFCYSGLLGLRLVRESHALGEFFPARGTENWKELDQLMAEAAQQSRYTQVRWFFQAIDRPNWCNDQDFEDLIFKVVSRYKDLCQVWEIGNEPNFKMSAQDYLRRFYLPFWRGARRADPGCTVLGPACVSLPETLKYLEISAGDSSAALQGVSTHSYVGPGEPWEFYGNTAYLDALKARIGNKVLFQSEQGYMWLNTSKQQHARYVVRQLLNGLAKGIPLERHYYFYPVHRGFEPWYLIESGSAPYLEGTVEPAGVAVRIMNEQLQGASLDKVSQPRFGLYLLRCRGDKEDVLVVWTLDFKMPLAFEVVGVRAFDFMGNPLALASDGKVSRLTADGYPLYLRIPKGAAIKFQFTDSGVNYALGARATASSSAPGKGPDQAVDGSWSLRDSAPGLAARTFWLDTTNGASPTSPDWLEIDIKQARLLNRAVFIWPLAAIDSTPRDFSLQLFDGKGWKTVSTVKDFTGYCANLTFEPTKASKARLTITRLNDGWHLDGRWMFMVDKDFKQYTDQKTRVMEFMLFGP